MNEYFHRHIDTNLLEWKKLPDHKPLLLRGARQVGKSSAVRHLSQSFDYYVEVDLERRRDLHALFTDNLDVDVICQQLNAIFKVPIVDGKTLVFIDEIQSCPRAIASLRYFYEQRQDLHVIAAGSLLEFALEELPSFGVGRIESLFMYPFSFDEFIGAQGFDAMLNYKKSQVSPESPLPEPIYEQLLNQFRTFLIIGGMPAVVAEWIKCGDYSRCNVLQNDLLLTYRDDFAKYKTRIPATLLWKALQSVAQQAGQKFVYTRADENESRRIKDAVALLRLAGLVYPVTHTSANGLPLGAEANDKYRKFLFFDTGLMLSILDLDVGKMILESPGELVNRGGLAEVAVGLEMMKYSNPRNPLELFYWVRMSKNALAEVDYVQVIDGVIAPIEVKSGYRGAMQSLRIFMEQKHIACGYRVSLENFCSYDNIKVYPMFAISTFMQRG